MHFLTCNCPLRLCIPGSHLSHIICPQFTLTSRSHAAGMCTYIQTTFAHVTKSKLSLSIRFYIYTQPDLVPLRGTFSCYRPDEFFFTFLSRVRRRNSAFRCCNNGSWKREESKRGGNRLLTLCYFSKSRHMNMEKKSLKIAIYNVSSKGTTAFFASRKIPRQRTHEESI